MIAGLIGLISSKITQCWNYREKQLTIANNLRGNIQYELKNNASLLKLIKEDFKGDRLVKVRFEGLSWKHEDTLISSLGQEISYLKSDIIQKYAHFFNMMKQCQNSRNLVLKSQKEKENIEEIKLTANAYIESLTALERAGRELLELINKYYPE